MKRTAKRNAKCSAEVARESLREFGEVTTLHGIRYITEPRAHIVERLCWTIAIIACAVWCSLSVAQLFAKWQESPVITTFAQQATSISTVPFPAVTICPESKILKSVYNLEENFDYIKSILNGSINEFENSTEKILAEAISMVCETQFQGMTVNPTQEHLDMIMKISPSLEDVFDECTFSFEKIDCSELFQPVIVHFGLCFTFNMLRYEEIFNQKFDSTRNSSTLEIKKNYSSWSLKNGYRKIEGASHFDKFIHAILTDEYPRREHLYIGPPSGLQLTIKEIKGQSQQICSESSSENYRPKMPLLHNPALKILSQLHQTRLLTIVNNVIVMSTGGEISLHSPVEYPLPERKYFHISPNSQAMVAVRPDRIESESTLRPPKYTPDVRGCLFSEETKLYAFRNITKQNCILDMVASATAKYCNCSLFFLPMKGYHDEPLDFCPIDIMVKCKGVREVDHWKCKPSCNELRYRYHISTSNFVPSTIPTNATKDFQYTKLIIHFEESTYFPMRKSELYGITDLIANCGGLLGLFTGFSIISAMEICYFLSLRLVCRLRERHMSMNDDDPESENQTEKVEN